MVASFGLWTQIQPFEHGITTEGTIIGEIRVDGSDGDTFKPEIQFMTQEGETIVFVPGTSTSSRVDVGGNVDISYRPENPQNARNLDTPLGWVLYPAFALGLLMFIGGSLFLIRLAPQKDELSDLGRTADPDLDDLGLGERPPTVTWGDPIESPRGF